MNGVAVITSRGLISIRITEAISTVQTLTTTATKTACLPERTMHTVVNLTIPNGHIFTSTRAEASYRSSAIQRPTAMLIVTVLCVAMKKDSRIGRCISSVIVFSDNGANRRLLQDNGGLFRRATILVLTSFC